MNSLEQFYKEKKTNINALGNDKKIKELGILFMTDTFKYKYSYNFTWMGRPIIAYPQDMIAMQELIWEVQPDLIIETGIAHGGSIVYYASLLELIGNDGFVIGIDIDIRPHNRELIEKHPMFKRIKMLEGSSVDESIINHVYELSKDRKKIMICLDSNHTHEHVLKELELYTPLVSVNSYCVVFDTVIEDRPDNFIEIEDRPWGKGNNPKTAVWEFLKNNDNFVIDKEIENKLVITSAPDGFLKRVK